MHYSRPAVSQQTVMVFIFAPDKACIIFAAFEIGKWIKHNSPYYSFWNIMF